MVIKKLFSVVKMKFGIVGPISQFPPIEKLWERVKKNEEEGYDSVWFGDHLMAWYPQSIWTPEILPIAKIVLSPHLFWDPFIAMAMVAKETKKIMIGTAVTEAVRRHPVMIAQSILTVDHISKGRAILGIGAGEGENIVPYGVDFSKPVSKMEEAIKIIKLCFESKLGELLNFDGKFWKLKDATFDVPLYQGRKPPIWVGGMGQRVLRITGKYADGWLPFISNPEEYKRCLGVIKETMEKEGRDFKRLEKAVYVSIIIDKDKESCLRIMKTPIMKMGCLTLPSSIFEKYGYEHPLGKDVHGLLDYIPSKFSKEQILDAITKIPDEVLGERYVYGSVSDVIDTFEKFEKTDCEHIIMWNETYVGDFSKLRSSYGYIREVIKYFREKER